MSKWHLIQPLQREICQTYKTPTFISYIVVRSLTLRSCKLYRACPYLFGLSTLWLQQRQLVVSDNLHVSSSWYLRTQQTFMGQERMTNPQERCVLRREASQGCARGIIRYWFDWSLLYNLLLCNSTFSVSYSCPVKHASGLRSENLNLKQQRNLGLWSMCCKLREVRWRHGVGRGIWNSKGNGCGVKDRELNPLKPNAIYA